MPYVWIGKTNAPSTVNPDNPFQVSWNVWYFGWPNTRIYSQISWDSQTIRKNYKVRWFICRIKTNVTIPGINKKTDFTISVGWRD